MFPKITKTASTFSFDTRLEEDELELLQDCIGKRIGTIHFEKVDIYLPPSLNITAYGRCCMSFIGNPQIMIRFKSLPQYMSVAPISDKGGLLIQKILLSRKGLRATLLLPPPDIGSSFVTNIGYPIQEMVSSISFYGVHERRNLKAIDPDVTLKDLRRHDYEVFPDVTIDSIEFIVIKHEGGQQTILVLMEGGFWVQLPSASIEEIIANRPDWDNIILQHKVC